MHLNPTCPGTETRTLPDHHVSAWADSQGYMASTYQGRIWSTFLLKISLQDVPRRRNEFLGTHKWSPSLQSQGSRAPWAQRVEQYRAGRGRRKQKVKQPLAQICLCGHEESLCPHRQTQGVAVLHPAVLNVLVSPWRGGRELWAPCPVPTPMGVVTAAVPVRNWDSGFCKWGSAS